MNDSKRVSRAVNPNSGCFQNTTIQEKCVGKGLLLDVE